MTPKEKIKRLEVYLESCNRIVAKPPSKAIEQFFKREIVRTETSINKLKV